MSGIRIKVKKDRLERTTDTYFEYFSMLAKLDNEMVVFTSQEHEKRVLELRAGRATKVILLDFNHKFKYTLKKIAAIQNSDDYKKRIRPEEAVNPECWSPEYVLVNNLKYYFLNRAISSGFCSNELMAWVDFGYCRKNKTTYGITHWYHPFDKEKIHFFTVRNDFKVEPLDVAISRALRNEVFIGGSSIVAEKSKWHVIYKITSEIQQRFMKQGIVDDDQGTLLIAVTENRELFELHSGKKRKWFYMFRLFNKGSKVNYLTRIKLILGIVK